MSSLKCYSSIFTAEQLEKLRHHNILTILDFLQEPPDKISKIANLRFKDILEMKEKLQHLFKGDFYSGLQLHSKNFSNLKTFPRSTRTIEQFLAELEHSTVYELCGLSGSGKTQVCLQISACLALTGHKVHFIDTKSEFSSCKVCQIINLLNDCKDDAIGYLNRITVTKVDNLYQLVNVLHRLKFLLASKSVPFIIIDCISTLYFVTLGLKDNTGLALLNHIASIIKFLKSEFHTTIILTNLAAKYTEKAPTEKIKPCLGNYWSQVCDTRIEVRRVTNSANITTLEKDDRIFSLDLNSV